MKIVNVFQEGGVPKRVSYRSLPKLNRDYGTGDPERVSSVKQSIQSARDWQTNWYAKRKGTGKFEDQLDPETMSFINDKTANSAVIVSDGANYRNNNANGITRVTEDGTVITANADPTYERIAPSFGRDFDTVLTHELAHAATLKSTSVSGQTQQEFDENSKKVATPSLMKINDIVGGGIVAGGDNDYINNAAEVQARLNSMRREAKMNPEKTDYTYKDMKYWLKKYNIDYGKDKSELLMNTVAQVTPTDSRTLFAQEGTVLKQDNTRVSKPIIPEIIKAKPRQDQLIDLGGEPSTDTRTAAERNRDYWHPIKGAKERFKSSMRNGTNPLVGLERTVMPAMAGAALVTTPATLIGGTIGSEAVNNATGGFGKWLEGKTGIPSEIGEYLNPGAIYGGAKGYNITKNKLASKFIKGDADLGWSPLINTKRFKYYKDIPIRKGSHYRVVTGQEPINDAITSGVIRTKAGNKAHSSGKVNTSKIKLKPKTVTYDAPYFQKEKLYYSPNSRDKVIVGNDINTPFRKIGLKNNIEQYPIGTPIIEGDITSPYINGKFGVAPSKDFTYFDRGLFGWREKTFDNNNGLINKNHWIFNKEARTPTNITMAAANRVMPFLSNMEKTPARIAAYKVGRRTKGNASVSLKDIKNNESTYTGSATPEGNNGDRDLLGLYLFQNDPLISRSPWFQRIAKSFKPAKGQRFNYDKRYSELYPGIEGRRYQMQSVVKSGHPLRFNNVDEFNNYSNGIGKLQGKEGDMVIEMPDGFQTFRQPGTNYVGPIDDVGGHVIKIDYNKKGKLTQISQDMWKFNPRDYAKRWSGDNVAEGVRATKQAALMDKVGTPFILQQENPIYIGSRRVWDSIKSIPKNPYIRRQPLMQGALLTMKKGGSLVSDGRRFKFKDSPLVRNSRTLNNKRDMRKKFMKSDRPTYSTNRVRKGQDGLQFVSYTPVETPDIPKFESSDVFSTYNIPIVRDESVVSQPKVDEPRIDEPIIESAVNTPMKRELFNIKPSKGLDEFNKWYDEVEKEDPEAKHYRQFLTKMAEQESGFNSAIQNRAGAPAYGYFQFMQDGKKYNNITAYAGTDIETFRNNPKLQIKAAIKLAKSFERGFNKKDLELAAQKGYTKFGLLGGAWLAGNGGVRKYLQGLANPSDRHWSKSGSGTDVASRIQMFNF